MIKRAITKEELKELVKILDDKCVIEITANNKPQPQPLFVTTNRCKCSRWLKLLAALGLLGVCLVGMKICLSIILGSL